MLGNNKAPDVTIVRGRVTNKTCPNPNCDMPVKGMEEKRFLAHYAHCKETKTDGERPQRGWKDAPKGKKWNERSKKK